MSAKDGRSDTARHGHARAVKSKTYGVWSRMKSRCRNLREHERRCYLDRGIAVCSRWEVFDNFLADMGEVPDGMSLDRIDNDKGYSPDNCRWATKSQQAQNRRGAKLTDAAAVEILARLNAGQAKAAVAIQYGVSRRMVSMINAGQRMPQAKAILKAAQEETNE